MDVVRGVPCCTVRHAANVYRTHTKWIQYADEN